MGRRPVWQRPNAGNPLLKKAFQKIWPPAFGGKSPARQPLEYVVLADGEEGCPTACPGHFPTTGPWSNYPTCDLGSGCELGFHASHDDAALWEIDENFARAELTDAQRAEHHVRREDILKRKGLVNAKPGPARVSDNLSATQSYAAQAAETLGVNRRTVERDLARAKKIAPDILAEVAGTVRERREALP